MGYKSLRLKPGCLSHHVLCIQLWPQLRIGSLFSIRAPKRQRHSTAVETPTGSVRPVACSYSSSQPGFCLLKVVPSHGESDFLAGYGDKGSQNS